MSENKSRQLLQHPPASNFTRELSTEAGSFAARSLRTSESRVTIRRRLASMRVGTQRRRHQRIAAQDRYLLDLSGPEFGNREK